jgi:hypothetical protein
MTADGQGLKECVSGFVIVCRCSQQAVPLRWFQVADCFLPYAHKMSPLYSYHLDRIHGVHVLLDFIPG